MTGDRENFDTVAQNLAGIIDAILSTQRERQRRIELIRHQVRHALALGYKAGRTIASVSKQAVDESSSR